MNFVIEAVQHGDLRSVLRLAWRTSSYPLPFGFFEHVAETQPDYFRVVRDRETGRVLAFIIAARRQVVPGNLLLLAAHPDYQNLGLRRALLRDVQRVLAQEGEREFTIEVGLSNREMIDFYQREGFVVVGVEAQNRGESTDRVVLSKRLDPLSSGGSGRRRPSTGSGATVNEARRSKEEAPGRLRATFVVEAYQPKDLLGVMRLAAQTLPEQYPYQFYAGIAESQGRYFRIARHVESDEVIGFLIASRQPGAQGRILLFAVASEQQGLGVGRALLRDAQRTLALDAVRTLQLEVRKDNVRAIQFYAHNGFNVSRLQEGAYQDGGDALWMSKPLV